MKKEEIVEYLKSHQEMNPDKHDGSYELVRTTISSFEKLPKEKLDVQDLDLLYSMTIGTWKSSFLHKRRLVDECNLTKNDKSLLHNLIDKMEERAKKSMYSNDIDGKNQIGLFGTGFLSFKGKSDKQDAIEFISLCIEISKLDDENKILAITENKLNRKFKGVRAASGSQILHCLKPFIFPILNSQGVELFQNNLKLPLNNSQSLTDYMSNVRIIKEFRDNNFNFKNYRIIDFWKQNKGKDMSTKELSENSIYENISSQSLNIILYGPPGTGKTYSVIERAIKIANPDYVYPDNTHSPEGRSKIKEEYNRLLNDGKIVFTTFHQSLSYEDFIEGIKPSLSENKNNIKYEMEPGIFMNICEAARQKKKIKTKYEFDESKIEFYKMSLGNTLEEDDDIFEYCIENSVIALGYGYEIDYSKANDKNEIKKLLTEEHPDKKFALEAVNRFKNWMKINDIVLISKGNKSVRAIGRIIGDYYYDDNTSIRYNHFRKVEWLYSDTIIPVNLILNNKILSQMTIYQFYKKDININYIKNLLNFPDEDVEKENYVLIIDEINRGNVSQIFGELITLIEDDKRAGKPEALEVILPYSKEKFSVPPNLHIIGTMNTADRSVEALDTALRRRFSFEFMPPKYDLPELNNEIDEIKIPVLLKTINERITYLLDEDHQIGHSYFMNITTEEELKEAFKNKIIPLLKEYFYNDYGKIRLILGDKFVEKIEENKRPKFAVSDEDIIEREQYKLMPVNDIEDFISALRNTIGNSQAI